MVFISADFPPFLQFFSIFYLMKKTFLLLACALSFGKDCQAEPVKGRAETNLRYGSERSILMTEFWAPLTQDDSSVFFTDLRLMGDDQDNREGNLGLGYRHMLDLPLLGEGIGGLHGWIDRRITERGSKFHQTTLGAEWMGDVFDIRLNGYIGLSDDRAYGSGSSTFSGTPYFEGTGVFVTRNASGQVVEEIMDGADVEVGFTLPLLQDYTDNIRVYAGGYHFSGEHSETINGWRTRFTTDITSDFQIGARFQRDDERGSQGFLEATIRFPFGHKKSYRKEGLKARLDESPERDIDIVTGSAETASAVTNEKTAVINAQTGTAQRIFHVDNSNVAAGDGSREAPYNTLQAAEAAAGAYDIIYLHHGDGTTANQDQGISLSHTGQKLIGSGADFSLGSSSYRIYTREGLPSDQMIAATAAPVITNINANGDGVAITADDVVLQGVEIDSASRYGVSVIADGAAASAANVQISNVDVTGSKTGLYFHGANGGAVSASVQASRAVSNTLHGISIYDDTSDTFIVDLGGGSFGSAGYNVIAENGMEDLSLEYDGRGLSAQNNWWGQAGGPVAGQVYFGAPLQDDLVGHWLLDETAGTTVESRIGNHTGTFVNSPALSPTGGLLDGAVAFDGGDSDYISIADYDAADTGDKLTVSYWINPDSVLPTASHVMKWEEPEITKNSSWGVRTDTTGEELFVFIANGAFDNGGNYFLTSNVNLSTGTWQNISFVYDGAGATNADRLKVYKDAVQVAGSFSGTIPGALNNTNEDIAFGRRLITHPSFADYFDGRLDDVRIYNGALTPGQVGEINRSRSDSTLNTAGSLSVSP